MIQENIYIDLLNLYFHFLFHFHSNNLIVKPFAKTIRYFLGFFCWWRDDMNIWTYNFVSLIVKKILLESAPSLSTPVATKTWRFAHLSFNLSLRLINCISKDLRKSWSYLNDTAIAAFFRIDFFPSPTVFSNNLPL